MPKPPEKPPGKPESESIGKIALKKVPSQAPGQRAERVPTLGERLAADFALRARTSSDSLQVEAALQRMLDHARNQFLFLNEDESLVVPELDDLADRFRNVLSALAAKNIKPDELYADVQQMIGKAAAGSK